MSGQERRVHARVSMEHPCTVLHKDAAHEGKLRELSRGGASVVLHNPAGKPGDRARLRIRTEDLPPVELPCELVHTSEGETVVRVGLKFVELSKDEQASVESILGSAATGPGGGARKHARVSRRLEVSCQSAEETRAVMCDLSQGGIGMVTAEPLTVGEEVTVTVQLSGFPKPLKLRGEVVHVRPDEPGQHHAGVRFGDLAPDRKGVLRDLIQFLVTDSDE